MDELIGQLSGLSEAAVTASVSMEAARNSVSETNGRLSSRLRTPVASGETGKLNQHVRA